MSTETQELVLKRLAGIIGENQDTHSVVENRLADMERQINQLASALTAGPKPRQTLDDDDDVWPKRKQKDAGNIAEIVAAAVKEATAPLVEELGTIKNDRKADSVRAAQQQSFNAAATQYPDLADPNSELSKIADSIFKQRPDLAVLPDAPMVISSMAKGILADTRKVNQEVTNQKRNAAVTKPSATGNLELESLSADRNRAEQAKELRDKLIENSHKEGINPEGYADMFRLKLEELRSGEASD